MIVFGLFIGIISYTIFFLGIFAALHPLVLQLLAVITIAISLFIARSHYQALQTAYADIRNDVIAVVLFLLLLAQIVVNTVGVLGPELGFDALWYHLTLPKLYLLEQSIVHMSGGLLYYSDMPKLAEMLYTMGLSIGDERLVKAIHFSFGLLTCGVIYQITRRYVSARYSLVGVLAFYTSLVVGWESTSAYIDLVRAFYEILVVYALILWYEKKRDSYLYVAAVCLGLAISTKLLSLGTLGLCVVGILYLLRKNALRIRLRKIFLFVIIAVSIPLPWFVFSYLHTGNPLYPFFTHLYPVTSSFSLFHPMVFFGDIITLFLFADDPISPLFFITAPCIFFYYKRFPKVMQFLAWYSLLALVIWYGTPRTGGGRFILPYLPVWSVVLAYTLSQFKQKTQYTSMIVLVVVALSVISIGYRTVANYKYVAVITGVQNKSDFLQEHLDFSFGDFYDVDGYFQKTITASDRVLLVGFHNLYYVDFPYVHESWTKKGDRFNYLATQNSDIPKRFSHLTKVYTNKKTNVSLYTNQKIFMSY